MLAICSRAYLRKGTLARTFSYKVIGVSRNTQGRSLSASAAQSLSRPRRRMMGTMKSSQNRERMLFDQLPLVKIIARRIYYRLPKHVLFEDLVQARMVGLLDAWQKYDCNRRVQFGSYAKVRIRGAILDSLRELDWGHDPFAHLRVAPRKREMPCVAHGGANLAKRRWRRIWLCHLRTSSCGDGTSINSQR
jgi:hypothetical protein